MDVCGVSDVSGRMPSLQAVFKDPPVPCTSALDLFVNHIDYQLDHNDRELDRCLQSILKFTNDLPGSKKFSTPKDGLSYMYSSNVLEKDSCYDPEIEDVMAMLTYLQKTLEQCPGCDKAVLQEILALSSLEGLCLPLKASDTDSTSMSMVSLNMVVDSSDQLIEQKWKKITYLLKKSFCEKLLQLPVLQTEQRKMNIVISMRLNLLQSLRAISPDDDVWNRYRSLRSQQLEQCFTGLLPEGQCEPSHYRDFSQHCHSMANIIISMIDEDFIVLNTGMFTKVTGVFKAIHDVYLEKYSDEMSLLVEEICDEISDLHSKTMAQSQSEFILHSKKNGEKNLKGGLAQSLDSMVTAPSVTQASTQEFLIPKACMESLLQILSSILRIEDHVDQLLRNTSWDVCGLTSKKTKRKGSLRGVLKPSSSPEMSRHSMNLGGISNSETNLEGSASSSVSSLHSNVHAPKVIERTKTEDRLYWDWRLIFKKVVNELAHGMEAELHDIMEDGIDADLKLWETSRCIQTCSVPDILQGGKLDYPKVISKTVLEFFQKADSLLPLGRAGREGTFQPVRMAFVEAISINAKNLLVHFTKLCRDVPSQAPMQSMHILLSSAAYVRNQLLHYEKVLIFEETGRKPLSGLYKQFVELTDSLSRQVKELHAEILATSVLHDAEASDWASNKEFYEDERCSFTIQMWNYYLRALKNDLWLVCPPTMAQNILMVVVKDTLMVITQRYVNIKPSYRRLKQFRYDVTSVLLCIEEFLFCFSSSPAYLLDPGHTDLPYYTIHNLCSTLFSAVAIVTSPLEIIYRVYKKGYNRRRESHEDFSLHLATSYTGSNTQWLHWMRPTLYHTNQKHYDDMQTTDAVYVQVMSMLHQANIDWGKLIQLLLMKDCTVSILLLTRCMEVVHHTQDGAPRSINSKLTVVPGLNTPAKYKTLFQSITNTLSLCQSFPDALSKSIIPVIERCDGWDYLNMKAGAASPESQPPLWIEALQSILDPFLRRVIEPVLNYLMNQPTVAASLDPLIMKISELPCGCPHNLEYHSNHRQPPSQKVVVESALKILISELCESVVCLPLPLCVMFSVLQVMCTQRNIKTGHNCVGLQIIVGTIRTVLSNSAYLEECTGVSLPQGIGEHLSSISDCLYHVLVLGRVKNQNTPKMATKFTKNNKEWLTEKMGNITRHFSHGLFSVQDNDILEGTTSAYADQLFSAIATTVLDASTGLNDMRTIHGSVLRNSVWLTQQLDVQCVGNCSSNRDTLTHFVLEDTNVEKPFSPMLEYQRLGDCCPFNQESTMQFPFKWSEILQSDLGLSEHGFRSLLFNRHEMQDGAYLEDVEKKPVSVLRSRYDTSVNPLCFDW